MRPYLLMSLVIAFILGINTVSYSVGKPETLEERFSYALGMRLGTDFANRGYEIDSALLFQGLEDALSGSDTLMTLEEAQAAMKEYQQASMKKAAEKNRAEGAAFLVENGKKEGIQTTASGLQYEVVKEGEGNSPAAADKVKVHYRGTLLNGKEFDSSYKRNQPAVFGVNQVIKGWTEALQLMKPGSRYKLFIPADLAYGDQGAGQAIGPGQTLIFDVELLEINPQDG